MQVQTQPAAKKEKMEVDESYPTENFKFPLSLLLFFILFLLPPSFSLHVVYFDYDLQMQEHKEIQHLMSSLQSIIQKVLNKEIEENEERRGIANTLHQRAMRSLRYKNYISRRC